MAIERAHRRACRAAARPVRGPRARRAPARPGDGRMGCGGPGGLPRSALRRRRRPALTRRQPRARVARRPLARRRGHGADGAAAGAPGRRNRRPGVLRLSRALVAGGEPGRRGLERRGVDLAGAGHVDRHQHAPRPRGHPHYAGLRRPRHQRPAARAPPPVAVVARHRGHQRARVPWRRDDAVSHDARRGTPACVPGVAPAYPDRYSPDCRRGRRRRPGVPRAPGGRGPNADVREAGRNRRPPDNPGVGCARPGADVDVARDRAARRRARRHGHRGALGERPRRHGAGRRIAAGRGHRRGHRPRSPDQAHTDNGPPASLEDLLGSGR